MVSKKNMVVGGDTIIETTQKVLEVEGRAYQRKVRLLLSLGVKVMSSLKDIWNKKKNQ